MVRKALKLASWTGAALAASGFYLYSNKYLDPNDFGAVRVGRAVATTAVISYDYLTSLRSVPYGSEEYLQLRSKVHLRSARRLCELCCANRGTFIKVGQHLGALDYLLPEEYTSTLKVLHSQAPQSSMHEVRQVIREDLGKEIHDLFVSFDNTPVGAASLAQVHKAVLRDGRTVAVKVQHPKVQSQSSKDILLMEVLVLAVKQLFPEFEFMWLVDEAKKNLPLELDFLNEGRNAEKVAQMLKDFDFLKVPRIYWELSTKRVLLMEFVDGGQVNDRDYMERNKIDVNEGLLRSWGEVSPPYLSDYRAPCAELPPGEVPGGAEAAVGRSLLEGPCNLSAPGCPDTYRPRPCCPRQLSTSVSLLLLQDAEIRNNAANYLPQISQLLNHVPRQMLLLFKTNDLLRGIEAALGTRASASSFLNMARCCIRALAAHKKKNSRSLFRRTQISFREAFSLWQINLHELILHVKGLRLASWVLALLCRLLPTSY
ncbi:aarF domain-containing protein kinase 1 isoform X2 [Meles meles]|uniref:aarF domain-containing protein kinase 1 isoform X2 n=1 Tax=Meles meles TaxID=9662 RepID=UPI001E698E2E|nr:aarF domain-containing protein kinase 1 isoform X2 [Meles meles]